VNLASLVAHSPVAVNLTVNAASCYNGQATVDALVANGPGRVTFKVTAGASNPNPIKIFIDSISVTNSSLANPVLFSASSSVGSQYAMDAAWINSNVTGGTLTWYN
jgi:hypothetical protein